MIFRDRISLFFKGEERAAVFKENQSVFRSDSGLLFSKRINPCFRRERWAALEKFQKALLHQGAAPTKEPNNYFSFPLPKVNFEHISLLVIFNFKF